MDTLARTAGAAGDFAAIATPVADSAAVSWGTVTAAGMFGTASRLAGPPAAAAQPFEWVVTGGVFYSVAILACFAGFCLLLYYFMPHAVTVVNMFRGTLYVEKLLDEHNYIFETFRRLILLVGMLITGLVIVRYGDAAWGDVAAGRLPEWALPLPVAAVWVGLLAIWAFQVAVIKTAGWLTYSGRFTGQLLSLRNLTYGLLFLLSTPLMLAVVLCPPGALPVLSVILFTVCGGLVIFLLIRTYLLFIGQKISILYWILYLCAVEILPVSFLVILAVRNIQ